MGDTFGPFRQRPQRERERERERVCVCVCVWPSREATFISEFLEHESGVCIRLYCILKLCFIAVLGVDIHVFFFIIKKIPSFQLLKLLFDCTGC